ncbi:hypothetical protein EST38_g7692 [Candolleomyces aberdarensis]|uniref:Uncharacterized protein n=1 Tax=Candolleomyces aberdarensis TaxID=2316362 RepID=A0A4Q2DGH0_9AGAR|nr:hypothetical protein EST38_g7692 [Candolleomyces aberdarensis]
MTALANGTYFISSTIGGSDRFYLGFSSGATRDPLVINSFTGSESQQKSTLSDLYLLQPPPQSQTGLIAATDPRNWYVTQADSGYVIGIDQSASLIWNVNEGTAEDNTNIILFPFQNNQVATNEFWKLRSIQAGTPSSTTSSSASSTSTPSPTCSCPAKEGMDLGDKIGLGVGLGVGIPTLLVAIVALFKDSPLAKYIKGNGRPFSYQSNNEEGFNLIQK